VDVTGAAQAEFGYDGDGRRIWATTGITTTVFVGSYFEWNVASGEAVSYYYAGATRLAMRTGGQAAVFLIADHLGSVNQLVDPYGAPLAGERQLYMPWGENRLSTSISLTRVGYTGQYEDGYITLYWMNARWYDPALGRWVQPDTDVPLESQGTQAWDRFAYVNNNALRYIDPSGHQMAGDTIDNGGSLDDLFEDDIPQPDAPPDSQHPLPNGHPAPPHIPGLPDDQWEWGDWPGVGQGYRNNQDPTERVWRPDEGYTNKKGNEGEQPHWNGRVPGEPGKGINFPHDYQWGRPGQPSLPGEFTHGSNGYHPVSTSPGFPDFAIPTLPPPDPRVTIPPLILILFFIPFLAFGF
jgi:RHS repeat-associated protein